MSPDKRVSRSNKTAVLFFKVKVLTLLSYILRPQLAAIGRELNAATVYYKRSKKGVTLSMTD